MLLLVELDTAGAEMTQLLRIQSSNNNNNNSNNNFAAESPTGGAKASECRAQADAEGAAGAAEAQGGAGRGGRGVREEGAALGRVGDRAGAVEGAGGEAAAGRGRLLLLRLRLLLRHGAVQPVGRRARHVVPGAGRRHGSCWGGDERGGGGRKERKMERKNAVGQRSRHILKKSQALCVAVTYQPEPLQG